MKGVREPEVGKKVAEAHTRDGDVPK